MVYISATTLLSKYGPLEALLEHAEEVSAAKVRTNLLEGRQNAALYKRLATIVCDLPLETPFEEWQYPGPDAPRAEELFQKLEFRTLARRLPAVARRSGDEAPVAAEVAPLAWRRVVCGDSLFEWSERAR